MSKVYPDAKTALDGLLHDNMTVAAGGFGLCGIPENLIAALHESGVKGLTIVGNNAGVDGFGMGVLLPARQVKKVMASYVGENKEFERQVLAGELELELIPQGTLAERLRAGGAGIPGFYTRTAFGTKLADGKETKKFDGKDYVLEPGITAEVSLVKAWKGDKTGNLIFRKTSRNFNPMIATCGKVCVAEVEQLVEIGELDPDQVHTPGIYVDRIIQGAKYEKRIEFRTVQGAASRRLDQPCAICWQSARRKSCATVTTSISASAFQPWLPTTFPKDMHVTLQSENGLLGIGHFPNRRRRPDLVNAGKQTITTRPARPFSRARIPSRKFAGGHIDLAILGAFEVTDSGDIANWMIPGKMIKGPAARWTSSRRERVVAVMEHTSKDGSPKILKKCTLPITGLGVVNLIITDLCVFEVKKGGGLVLIELNPGVTEDGVRARTGAPFEVALKS
jgi:3-oxoacid CoA-transferase